MTTEPEQTNGRTGERDATEGPNADKPWDSITPDTGPPGTEATGSAEDTPPSGDDDPTDDLPVTTPPLSRS